MVVPALATNTWQMLPARAVAPLLRRLWPMLLGTAAGTLGMVAAGLGMRPDAGAGHAGTALGVVLVLYALLGLSPLRLPRVPPAAEGRLGALAGAATGAITAATGVFVVPAVPFLQALGLDRDALVRALGLYFNLSTLLLAVTLAGTGGLGAATAWGALAALPAALAGVALGNRVRRAVRPEAFRRCFFAGLLLLGLHLAAHGPW